MDTKKAFSAIIVLLLIINLTLGIYLIVINSGHTQLEDNIIYTRTILNNRNYRVDCLIPSETLGISSVTFGENRFSEQSIDSLKDSIAGEFFIEEETGVMFFINTGSEAVSDGITGRAGVEAAAENFIKSIGINTDEFILDYYRETGSDSFELKYINIGDGGNLYFGSYIEMNISSEGVMNAKVMYPDIVTAEDNMGDGIPLYTIILSNLVETGREMSIESIGYGYYSKGPGTVNVSWRIRFGDGEERYFDASTGLELE